MFEKNAIDFEASKSFMLEKSNKRAWAVTYVAFFLLFLSLMAMYTLVPLKTVELRVIKENVLTGETRIVTSVNTKSYTAEEATQRKDVATYVKRRTQYYFDMLSEDFYYVQLCSSKVVSREYKKEYEGDNARNVLLGDKVKIQSKILSVVLGNSNGTKTATVRTELTPTTIKNGNRGEKTILVISLAYDYFPNTKMHEKDSLLNGLGFKVLTYKINSEVR